MVQPGAVPDRENLYRSALRRLRGGLVMAGLFSAAVNLLMLTGPMFMLQVYDRVLSSGSVATLQALFVIVLALFIFLGLYDFLRRRLLSRAAYRLDQYVGQPLHDLWLRSGLRPRPGTGRPLNDLAVVRGFLPSPAMLGLFDTPWIPFYMAVVFLIHPWLGFLALAGLGIVTVLALLNQWATRAHHARAMQMDSAESFLADQSRRNAEAIVPLGMSGRVTARWAEMHRAGLAVGQVGGDRGEAFAAGSRAFRLALQSALLGLGGYLALQQEISAGMIVAVSIIAGRALAPVDMVIGQWRSIVRAREAHGRLAALFDAAPGARAAMQLPAPKGRLEVRAVTKFAPGGRGGARAPILDQVSFRLAPGDAVGVIGPSGSGKSSLARILVGAWRPDAGELRIDGATPEQWEDAALGRHIGYLSQRLELLAGTIRDNIARFDPEADDAAVIAAARLAGVHDMVLRLPDGYATELGHDHAPFSGGQVQRIGLARAVYGMPRYVVLDEPNSNLDASGDEALAQAIIALRGHGCTVVVMAHRPSAIEAVNKVLVLHGGRVAEFGPKEKVLQRATRPRRDSVEKV
ncbi:ATP-binding protein HasD [Roseovarius halotolerans]|uniref:Type I secretion system ATP-binding protein PrsD n=1 Tax=Roseovarius halotolerans TaxID=505353 RepID=A0A1X6YE92_9RHOB|nr:type I secretion system permease/ATPase [Roseovarius halotolerans]RKT34789.1 ATP-binding protein HasD [Roseovarius halotolerans]SLN18663.1 Type I secretion system ATP-binding protein PrsD [Roseovarius halotolerans]